MEFSPKQASFLAHTDAFISIADGAVRSGKTHAALIRFAEMCITGAPGDLAVFGKTERTVRRNVVYPLMELLPGRVRHVQGSGELYVYGRRCWVIGANDARAEEKVRGMTLAGAYANEVTLYPDELWQQLLDRCSVDGAQILADCNPDSPFHWLHDNYLTANLPKKDLKRFRFKLDDNPVLSQEYKQRLLRVHANNPLWLKRMIYGEWVVAEGAIYPMFDIEPGGDHVVKTLPSGFDRLVVGVDYGTATVSTFLLLGRHAGIWYLIKEYYHDAEETGAQKTDADFSYDFRKFLAGYSPISIEVDPSAASFKKQLRQDGVRKINDADNSVIDGIRLLSTALGEQKLKIHVSCKNTIKELAGYTWDKKAQEIGEDKPVKKNDHTADALRYASARIFGMQPQRALRVVR